MTAFYLSQWAVIICASIGVVCWYRLAKRHRSVPMFIAMELWLLNIILFSFAVLMVERIQPSLDFALWNIGIKLQGIIVITGEGIARLYNWKHIDD